MEHPVTSDLERPTTPPIIAIANLSPLSDLISKLNEPSLLQPEIWVLPVLSPAYPTTPPNTHSLHIAPEPASSFRASERPNVPFTVMTAELLQAVTEPDTNPATPPTAALPILKIPSVGDSYSTFPVLVHPEMEPSKYATTPPRLWLLILFAFSEAISSFSMRTRPELLQLSICP